MIFSQHEHFLGTVPDERFALFGVGVARMKEFHDLKVALVDIEMDVVHVKVRCGCLPHPHLRMVSANFLPDRQAEAFGLIAAAHKQEIQKSGLTLGFRDNDCAARKPVLRPQSICMGAFLGRRCFNVFLRKNVFLSFPKTSFETVLKRLLHGNLESLQLFLGKPTNHDICHGNNPYEKKSSAFCQCKKPSSLVILSGGRPADTLADDPLRYGVPPSMHCWNVF